MKVHVKVHALFLLLYAVLVLMLQGCVGAVVVSTAAVATKTATDPRTVGMQVDDSILTMRVANALAKDQQLKKNARIVNTVYLGKVLLTGQAPTPELAERAKLIALRMQGTIEVYNEIRLGQPLSFERISMDTWITIKIRYQLWASDKVKSSNIKVTTENGEVFLLGLVTNNEGKVAADLTSKVSGVKHVTLAFTYMKK